MSFKATEIYNFIASMNADNSSTYKVNVMKKYSGNEYIKKILYYTYNDYFQFHVTSKNCIKQNKLGFGFFDSYNDVFGLLDDLRNRVITGHEAIMAINHFISENSDDPRTQEVLYAIIDKDLKMRVSAKIINKAFPKLIPEFEIALAYSYSDYADKVDFHTQRWYESRKLDGVRNVTIIDENGIPRFYSREGNEFFVLENIKREIMKMNLSNVVLDGELCIVDEHGNENFKAIVSEIHRKDHTIAKPKYFVFDCVTVEEFENKKSERTFYERLLNMEKIFKNYHGSVLALLPQKLITSYEVFNADFEESIKLGYEGLILRADVGYEGKRSKFMLKVKQFIDDEFVVKRCENDLLQFINPNTGLNEEEMMLAKIYIEYKGFEVGVGSGFTLEERQKYYKYPELIIGKHITVQHFGESTNKAGDISLRFPTLKYIYPDKRNI